MCEVGLGVQGLSGKSQPGPAPTALGGTGRSRPAPRGGRLVDPPCRVLPQCQRRPQVFALGLQGRGNFPGCTEPAGTSVLVGSDGSARARSQEARM